MVTTYVFLSCLFLTYAAYLLATRKSDARRARMNERLAEALEESEETNRAQVQLSRDDRLSESEWLAGLLSRLRLSRELRKVINQADIQITVSRLIMFCAAAAAAAFLTIYTISDSLLIMCAAALMAASVPVLHIVTARRKRLSKFLEHLPDTLDLMSRSLAVGHAFSETLLLVATEMPEPIASEFRIVFEEQKLGLSMRTALQNLSERVPILDLRLCITAILIQRETGGNLAEILGKVSHTIRERFRMVEELKTLTTSSRMSAWILCALPFVLAFVVTVLNPEHMRVLWNDPRGHNLLYTAAALQIVGMLVIRKILKVRM